MGAALPLCSVFCGRIYEYMNILASDRKPVLSEVVLERWHYIAGQQVHCRPLGVCVVYCCGRFLSHGI